MASGARQGVTASVKGEQESGRGHSVVDVADEGPIAHGVTERERREAGGQFILEKEGVSLSSLDLCNS